MKTTDNPAAVTQKKRSHYRHKQDAVRSITMRNLSFAMKQVQTTLSSRSRAQTRKDEGADAWGSLQRQACS